MKKMIIQEVVVPGKRLGRIVHHDPQSWGFPAPMAGALVSATHTRHAPIFDQQALGSCVGNASLGCVGTGPFTHIGNEAEAVSIYSDATKIDDVGGEYPPDDTGSSGLAGMKVLQNRGLIQGFTHAFDFSAVLRALILRPGITGITWLEGCDEPDSRGLIHYTGNVRGGHELVLDALDVPNKLVHLTNSWGAGWGLKGGCYMSWDDYKRALADNGDATFPLV